MKGTLYMQEYNLKTLNRKKQWFRIILGAKQFILYPILNVLWALPLISGFLLYQLKNLYLKAFAVEEILQPIFSFCLILIIFIIPIVLIVFLLQTVAEFSARKDESKILMCFNKKQLENGAPLLISKKHGKNKNIIARTFFSYIPKHIWEEQQAYIEDIFNVRIIGIEYGKRANTIVLTTVKGRKSNIEDRIYDETV